MAIPDDLRGSGGAESVIQSVSRARANPTRQRILVLLAKGEVSASSLSKDIDDKELANLSYHLKYLESAGLIEVSRVEVPTRGCPVKFFRLKQGFTPVMQEAVALDVIAERLEQANGSPYAELEGVADVVRSTGRPVVMAGAA